ncbi:MAG: ABC transporter permease [Anaerolineales bacterium]|jgi:peptide/nickel transport system permease protein
MWTYISRRIAQALFILLIITAVCFLLTHFSADPMSQYANRQGMTAADRAAIAHSLGLDQPLPVQYVKWLWLALHGNLGDSFFSRQPVMTLISQRLPLTLELMVTAEVFIIIISLFLGIVSAVKQYSALDNVITSFSFIGYSMPIFFIALGLMNIFAVQFKAWHLPYLPTGADIWDPHDLGALAYHMVLPVSCLVIIQVAGYSRFLRSSILEVLGLDYVRTARAKGLGERTTLIKHALRNAMLPFITIIGLDIPFLLGGAIVTESIFAWPGMGRLFWEYAQRGDFPVVNGVLLIVSSAVVFFTIIVDVLYTFVDPRIRLS